MLHKSKSDSELWLPNSQDQARQTCDEDSDSDSYTTCNFQGIKQPRSIGEKKRKNYPLFFRGSLHYDHSMSRKISSL